MTKNDKSELFETVTRENCGYFLRKIRTHLGEVSLQEFAKIIGGSRTTILRIENDQTENVPSNDFMNRLKALQIIGLAKMKEQWKFAKQTNDFEEFEALGFPQSQIDELLEPGQIFTNLTSVGIITGMSAIQELIFSKTEIKIRRVPLLVGAGLMKGLNAIFSANKLSVMEEGAYWRIFFDEEKSDFIPINTKWERQRRK